jgi:hypothetical protein
VTAVALILATALLGALSLVAWLTYRTVKAATKEADERVAQNESENLLEREQFEHEVTKKALARSKKRSAILEQELFHEIGQPFPDADVAPDDHRARVRRFIEAWRDSEDGDDSLPAESGGAVSEPRTAEPTAAATSVRGTSDWTRGKLVDDTGLELP